MPEVLYLVHGHHGEDGDGGIHLVNEKNNTEGLKRLRHQPQRRLGDLGVHPHHLLHHSIYMRKGMPIGAPASAR